nr:MAG TPA_asm: hypothetical protein [Caudoviricetes sp.]DAW23744.1 MAG TPA: hypothetical protein [Caudoviricetes sp.]
MTGRCKGDRGMPQVLPARNGVCGAGEPRNCLVFDFRF